MKLRALIIFSIIFFVFYNCDLFEDDNPYSGITETILLNQNDEWVDSNSVVISEDPDDWGINYKPPIPKDLLLPQTYQIGPAFPNPSIDSTFIMVDTPSNRKINIYIKDGDNKLIKTIINDTLSPGYYHLYWKLDNNNGKIVNSGLYRCFYEIEDAICIDSVYYSIFGHGDIKIK